MTGRYEGPTGHDDEAAATAHGQPGGTPGIRVVRAAFVLAVVIVLGIVLLPSATRGPKLPSASPPPAHHPTTVPTTSTTTTDHHDDVACPCRTRRSRCSSRTARRRRTARVRSGRGSATHGFDTAPFPAVRHHALSNPPTRSTSSGVARERWPLEVAEALSLGASVIAGDRYDASCVHIHRGRRRRGPRQRSRVARGRRHARTAPDHDHHDFVTPVRRLSGVDLAANREEPDLGPLAVLLEDPAASAVMVDFDGTLAPIVADPASARAVPGAARTLGALAECFGSVAVVSGRPGEFLARRLRAAGPSVLLFGLYGMEEVVGSEVRIDPRVAAVAPDRRCSEGSCRTKRSGRRRTRGQDRLVHDPLARCAERVGLGNGICGEPIGQGRATTSLRSHVRRADATGGRRQRHCRLCRGQRDACRLLLRRRHRGPRGVQSARPAQARRRCHRAGGCRRR